MFCQAVIGALHTGQAERGTTKVNRCGGSERGESGASPALGEFVVPPAAGKISVAVIAHQPGAENSKPRLRELAARTLAEFELTGVVE